VPKSQYAKRDYYDVWLPILSPSAELVKQAQRADDAKAWRAFRRRFRAEMNEADASRTLDLLAALSHHASFSLGCYCADESRCHRSVLKELLEERGAAIA
jgi:uncharacterized protein YeaO (DUF488 family)